MENEFLNKLKTEATVYGKALGNVGRLRLIGIVSRILGLFLLIFTIVLCAFAILSFGAVAAINAMSQCMPIWAASLIIGSMYIVFIILAIAFRKPLFIHPFIALMTKQMIDSQEKLEVETLKAEHDVELQTVRMENRVENATQELNLYLSLIGRVWNWLKGRRHK